MQTGKSHIALIKRLMIWFILAAIPLGVIKSLFTVKNAQISEPEYVGKEACVSCHQKEYEDWRGSDHDLAMDFATDPTVLGNFNDAEFSNGKVNAKFYKKNGKYFVYTQGADGKPSEFQIKYVFGHYPLQQYLVEFPDGRLQTLALTWNSKDGVWYYMPDSIYKDEKITPDNWLYWTNQAQNWNSMCADCHSTNVKKNYDLASDSYHTTWSEIDVSCEACHGPGSEHIKWAKLPDYARKKIKNAGLLIKTSGIDNNQYVDNCARCHSRRSSLSDFNPSANGIYQHIIPALPTEPDWYIDGQIKSEDYVFASFKQSRMFMNDVKCNDCHNVHSGKLLYEGNALCLQCHKAEDYDTPRHTFHKGFGEKGKPVISESGIKFEVGSGTLCINCHMHGRNYMGVDYRRDHSFRIPRPDLTIKFGTPNACNQCHADKSPQWAQSYIEKWYGKSRPFQYGEAFAAAVENKPFADSLLKRIVINDLYPPLVRAIAIGYLSDADSNKTTIEENLNALEPAMRLSAIERMPLSSRDDLSKLLPLLNSETKAARFRTISKLESLAPELIPNEYQKSFNKALKEELEILKYNADFPVGKFNLANYYYNRKRYDKAEKLYLAAIKEDDKLVVAKINLAFLYSKIGKSEKAEKVLAEVVKENPNDGNALYNYGLALSENGKYDESLKYLLRASKLLKTNGRVDYNIAALYEYFRKPALAEKYLKQAIKKEPDNPEFKSRLEEFYRRNKVRK